MLARNIDAGFAIMISPADVATDSRAFTRLSAQMLNLYPRLKSDFCRIADVETGLRTNAAKYRSLLP
jgi:hypothetical protein